MSQSFRQIITTLLSPKRILLLGGLGFGMVLVIVIVRQYIELTPQGLRALLLPFGWWGGVILVGLIAAVLVVPIIPATILQVGAGVIFGPWVGFGLTLLADGIGALIGFGLARRWGRAIIRTKLRVDEQVAFDALCQRITPIQMIVLRILPGPAYTVVSFAAGCSTMEWWRYVFFSVLGVIPALAMLTIAGDLSTSNPWLAAGVGVTFVGVMIGLSRLARTKSD
ncbi:MAG: TVP38/TMEM64 family protein [Roseiflexaceae bacterium]